ncbi:hypothetical protein [Yersinia enterocolitica]|uniref:hypothetical protein n=1 Tax=Yersinia enterocolitica TaxID=630 RepID=UPI0029B676FE|nr:hypothetical protein [Yersinia enterocolitica]
MNVIEMHGLITGKCVAGDMFVNESVAEYLIRKIANIEDQRNAALNACTLIADALGIKGAVAGDTIAKVQQLVAENAAAIEAVRIFSNATEQLTEIIGDEIGMDGVSLLLHGFSIVGSMPATTQALNEIKAQGVDELSEWSLKANNGFGIDVTPEEIALFAASLRGEQNG